MQTGREKKPRGGSRVVSTLGEMTRIRARERRDEGGALGPCEHRDQREDAQKFEGKGKRK